MSKIELPPLPEPELTIGVKLVPYEERTFRSASLATKLGYGNDQRRYFTADQLRARDRQIVELCAALCDQYEMAKWKAYRHGHGPERASDYTQGQSDGAGDCGNAIRSLLDPAEKETSHGA